MREAENQYTIASVTMDAMAEYRQLRTAAGPDRQEQHYYQQHMGRPSDKIGNPKAGT
jgi:hypothetical protein